MAMQPRERVLATGLGLAVGLIVLYWGFGQYREIFLSREANLNNLKRNVSKQETEVALIRKALAQRKELEKRSLPVHPVEAQALYHGWLADLVIGTLQDPTITYRRPQGDPKGYEPLGFDVKGNGSLEQITKVLHGFYSAGHLHQITSLDIKPQAKGTDLSLTMQVEAIILPSADRLDSLSTEKGQSLALASLDDYRKPITERNLFAEYTPPAAKAPAGIPLDLAKVTYVTFIGHGLDERPMAWMYERTTNKTTKLYEGDEFEVAGVKGKVKKIDIDARQIELEIDGKVITVPQNKSLGDMLADRSG